MLRRFGFAVLLVAFTACHDTPAAPSGAGGASHQPPRPAGERRRTTDGGIAVGNLDAEIAATDRLARSRALRIPERAAQIDLLVTRGQYLGQIADYERAEAMADELVRDAPSEGRAFVTRAQARASFHRFADALADLDRAEELGAKGARTDGVRAGIFQAAGRYDEALALRRRIAATGPDVLSLGAEAAVLGELGDVESASATFARAEQSYRDVSPFPVSWLRFQEGAMWLREGELARARDLLQEAVDRLPAYAPAAMQLAQLDALEGRRDVALARLRPLAERSDDPDYAAQLARLLGEAGRPEESAEWRARAAQRFDELLAAHPDAFLDHAADFYLNAGGDAARAAALARRNAALRPTARAFELLLQAGLASNDAALACEAADGARRAPHRWPRLEALVVRAYKACGRWSEP